MSAALHDIKAWAPAPSTPAAFPDLLLARAERAYPDSEFLQREWLRAVGVVRRTTSGWLLDNPRGRVVQP
jgi:hypothetical protein